ncbi:MAG: GNAT family N-acetyltransferase [Clostridia bacterium]|nr:GNAT family N-acetyltransferase [Clostridia bacterium]
MNVSLKRWNLDDAAYLTRLCQRVDRLYLDYLPQPYNITDAQFFISNAGKREGKTGIYRAILFDGQIVGSISVEVCSDVRSKDSNLGYMVLPEFCRLGIATQAVNLAVAEAFSTFDILRVTAEVAEHNTASRALLKKCNFLLEGVKDCGFYKDGKACSLCIYGLLRRNYENHRKINAWI